MCENIKKYSNLLKIKSDSIIALRELNKKKQKFNYIYIDGFHDGSHVIVDAIEAFKLLDINGIMILDDFMHKAQERNISIKLVSERGEVVNPESFFKFFIGF